MFNLDGMIPKLCLIAQELGEEATEKQMRCASLQALSAMVICTMFIWMYYYVIFMHVLHVLAFQSVRNLRLHKHAYTNNSFIDNLFLMKHMVPMLK